MIRYISLFLCITLLLSCNGNRADGLSEVGDTLQLRYARNLTIVTYSDRTEVIMRNPWDTTGVLGKYCLTTPSNLPAKKGEKQSSSTEKNRHKVSPSQGGLEGAVPVLVPLQRAAVFSSVHCALFHELGADDAVGGICDLQFFNLPYYKEGVAEGRIANLGNSLQPNIEQIMNLNPDAMLPSPFENSGGLGRAERLGIPIIWCADYMEDTPLGRAEWIRFYGRLVDRANEADSIFCSVEKRYKELCTKAQNAKTKPRLLPEMPWSGQWTLPSSGSSSAKLYADAGADYLFAHLKGSGGIPLSTENVVDKAVDADIWLIKHHGQLDRQQMISDTPLLASIKAPIWWCDTSVTLLYEETPFHPERLLENLIAILHPELGVESKYKYFQELKVKVPSTLTRGSSTIN
ncbi:MAG: ABC transporter substrate-binding protein [Bacteroidaceae bacterium]|nr:ABC transporter substrate-binding protein [Bacteroidaceae bacterium]